MTGFACSALPGHAHDLPEQVSVVLHAGGVNDTRAVPAPQQSPRGVHRLRADHAQVLPLDIRHSAAAIPRRPRVDPTRRPPGMVVDPLDFALRRLVVVSWVEDLFAELKVKC